MKTRTRFAVVLGGAAIFALISSGPVWAQAKGHASIGLGHGEEGFFHLEEMIKHLEFSLSIPNNTDSQLKTHSTEALTHAKEALKHYDEALRHASESLGRPARHSMMEGSGGPPGEDPQQHGYMDEGSH